MSQFTIHTLKSAPDAAKPMLEGLNKAVGFVPNLAAAMADNPLVLETYAALAGLFGRGTFSPVEREVMLMATAGANNCTYCMAAHSTFASAGGASEAVREAVRAGKTPDDPRLAALVTFARQVVRGRGQVAAEDIQQFLSAGFTQAQVLEVLVGVMQGTMASFVYHLTDVPLDAGFQPQQWTKIA